MKKILLASILGILISPLMVPPSFGVTIQRKAKQGDINWGNQLTTATDNGHVGYKIPRYFSSDAFSDNLTLYGNDVIAKGPWVDVRAYGVVANDNTKGTVNSAALSAATAAVPNGGKVLFPAGVYTIASGWVIDGKHNVSFEAMASGKQVGGTSIRWSGSGSASGTMLTITNSQFLTFKGITFMGNSTDVTSDRTGVGLYSTKGSGYNTQFTFIQCGWAYFTTGIQIGHLTTTEDNNENHVFRECFVTYCDTGYRQYWPNSLNISWESGSVSFCTKGFDLGNATLQAGSLSMYNMDIGHNTTDIYFTNGCGLRVFGLRSEVSGKFIDTLSASNARIQITINSAEFHTDSLTGTYAVTFNHGLITFNGGTLGGSTEAEFLLQIGVSGGRAIFNGVDINGRSMHSPTYAGLTDSSSIAFYGCREWIGNAYFSTSDGVRLVNAGSSIFTFTDNDATPSVSQNNWFKIYNTDNTTITAFDNGYVGQIITVIFSDSITTIEHSVTGITLKSATNVTPANTSVMTFINVTGIGIGNMKWLEVSRSF